MMPDQQPSPTEPEQEVLARSRRRVIFPWVLLACLVGVLAWINIADFAGDERFIFSTLSVILSVILLGFWYLVRGQRSIWLRLGLAAAPFLLIYGFGSLFEFEHDGDARIVGLTWQGGVNPDQLLAPIEVITREANLESLQTSSSDYPRFLGNGYWPEVVGVNLATDWKKEPPKELWRQPIGAGWSSIAMVGGLAFTQEQRGPSEIVVCYEAKTGKAVWTHENVTRFDPEDTMAGMGGRGPRATPTVGLGVVLTHGATGILNCLEATTGKVRWAIDTATRFKTEPLTWGNSSSPLLVDCVEGTAPIVIIALGGPQGVKPNEFDASLIAIDLATGDLLWKSGWRETSYASPSLIELDGVRTVVQVNQDFVTGYALSDGSILWEHPWPGSSSGDANTTQAIPVGSDQLLLSKGYGFGASLVEIKHSVNKQSEDDLWTAEPVWSPPIKTVLKTKLSNLVVRDGYAYGLDAGILQCVEIATGDSQWKKRRRPAIGHGQLLIVGNHLLITSETGELILANLNPKEYEELGVVRVLSEDKICWNNPAFSQGLLLVRNSEEIAAFQLPLISDAP